MIIASKAFKTWFDLYEDTQAVPIIAETNSVTRRLVLEGERDDVSDVMEGLDTGANGGADFYSFSGLA